MNNSDSQPTPYSSPTTLSLIDDLASVKDARDWLTSLIDCQTNSYKLQSLRSQIHYEQPHPTAVDRIESLRAARMRLHRELSGSELEQLPVRIKVSVEYYVNDAANSDNDARGELV